MENRITYEKMELKIGDKITCTNLDDNPDFYEQHLTVGKKYTVKDVDYHFPDSVCVKSDRKKAGQMFFKCSLFYMDLKEIRKKKLDKISKKS